MPEFFDKPTVLGVGEIGFHKTTKNEEEIFEAQVEQAIKYDQLILIHTPHLQDKVRGTKRTLEVLSHMNVNPERVWIDHVEEHTIRGPLEAGYWVGFTLYPITKCTPKRAVDMLEMYGHERILVNSSADWGPSDPFTLQQCVVQFRARGYSVQDAIEIFHNNPLVSWDRIPSLTLNQFDWKLLKRSVPICFKVDYVLQIMRTGVAIQIAAPVFLLISFSDEMRPVALHLSPEMGLRASRYSTESQGKQRPGIPESPLVAPAD